MQCQKVLFGMQSAIKCICFFNQWMSQNKSIARLTGFFSLIRIWYELYILHFLWTHSIDLASSLCQICWMWLRWAHSACQSRYFTLNWENNYCILPTFLHHFHLFYVYFFSLLPFLILSLLFHFFIHFLLSIFLFLFQETSSGCFWKDTTTIKSICMIMKANSQVIQHIIFQLHEQQLVSLPDAFHISKTNPGWVFPTKVIISLLVLYRGHTKTPVSLGTRIVRLTGIERSAEGGWQRQTTHHTQSVSAFILELNKASHNVEKV